MTLRIFFSLLFVCALGAVVARAQRENVWVFATTTGLDFNTSPPVPITTAIPLGGAKEAAASVCDNNGQLLFYTEGLQVWDRNNTPMPNGNGICPTFGAGGQFPTASTTQGAVIVPMPGSQDKYYVFSLTSVELNANAGRLYYSVVDMSLNGGFGDVVAGQKAILIDSALTEKMTAVRGNGCNIWLMTCSQNDHFKAYNVTGSGVNTTPVVSGVGLGGLPNGSAAVGCIAISPDRSKLAAVRGSTIPFVANYPTVALYDFNPATGLVTNPLVLYTTSIDNLYYGACFSPDNSKLYLSSHLASYNIAQFDLSSNNPAVIPGTLTQVGSGADYTFTKLKLGPDGKIYFAHRDPATFAITKLGSIDQPNLAGAACQVNYNVITLPPGASTIGGFPSVVAFVPYTPLSDNDTVFACAASVTITADGGAPYSYSLLNGTATVTGSGPAFTITPTTISTILLHSVAHSGCDSGAAVTDTFMVVPAPVIDAGLPDTLEGCASYVDTLQASLGNTTSWASYNLQWTPAATITSGGTTLTPSIHPIQNTTYTLTLTTDALHGNCTISDSVRVVVKDKTVTPGFSYLIKKGCSADTVVFSNSSVQGTQYAWDFGDGLTDTAANPVHVYTSQNSYAVKLTASNSTCMDSTFHIIDTRHPLTASLSADKDTICQNNTINFRDSSIISVQPASYAWTFGDGGTATTMNPSHFYSLAGVYNARLVVTDGVPCSDTAYHVIVVDSVPSLSFTESNRDICTGQMVDFAATYTPDGNIGLTWDFGDGTTILNTDQPAHAYDEPGIFTVTLQADYRVCNDLTYTDSVVVSSFPLVNLGPDTSICLHGNAIVVSNLAPVLPGYRYRWSTGDTTQHLNIVHDGTYSLRVTSEHDCATTDEIVVHKDCYIDIPNSFTPNNDGTNDYFFPRQLLSLGVTGFTMQVFNRWGQIVFETTHTTGRGWDGRFNGKDQPEGVYIYLIKVLLKNNQAEVYNGNVTLLR